MLLVHPDGPSSKVSNAELNISFDPTPDYADIARAASGGTIFAAKATTAEGLQSSLGEAIRVAQSGTSAVLDVVVC